MLTKSKVLSFIQQIFVEHVVWVTILDTGNIALNKTHKSFTLMKFTCNIFKNNEKELRCAVSWKIYYFVCKY